MCQIQHRQGSIRASPPETERARRRSMVTELRMCASGGAPFPLQPDAFSGRVALNFNRLTNGIPNRGALFEKSVNAQGEKSPDIRLLFAVAKMGNPPYCGEA